MESLFSKLTDFFCFVIFVILILMPLVALFYRLDLSSGLNLFAQDRFWSALYTSTKLALFSSKMNRVTANITFITAKTFVLK